MHETEAHVVASVKTDLSRGIGVLDMARSIRARRPHHTPGTQALHVLEIMLTVGAAAGDSRHDLTTSAEKPPLLPEDWNPKAATL